MFAEERMGGAQRIPYPGELNDWILAEIDRTPIGGGYRFEPEVRDPQDAVNPRDPNHDGVRADLNMGGERVAIAAADGSTYCCGVTFETVARAWRAWSGGEAFGGLAAPDARALIADWFCPTLGHSGAHAALISRGLGVSVPPETARPGDVVQFWRSVDPVSPSGHSAVFLGWQGGSASGRVLRYWSSQPATGGIGVHEEPVRPHWQLFTVRVGEPGRRPSD